MLMEDDLELKHKGEHFHSILTFFVFIILFEQMRPTHWGERYWEDFMMTIIYNLWFIDCSEGILVLTNKVLI